MRGRDFNPGHGPFGDRERGSAGPLFKGGAYLERLASVDTVVFDKTGTLTHGRPTVVDVVAFGGSAGAVLEAAAALEQRSEHALADAVVDACRARGITPAAPETFEAVTGRGVRGMCQPGARVVTARRRTARSTSCAVTGAPLTRQDREEC
ncbi:MAG TPA: HAD family hydrolase [bacterium]|nr:HAD family hydrolase [bacterium]